MDGRGGRVELSPDNIAECRANLLEISLKAHRVDFDESHLWD